MKKNTNKNRRWNYIMPKIYFLLIFACLSACKKEWLEAKADLKQAVPSSIKDFQAMLDDFGQLNINNSGMSYSLSEIAADGHYYTESSFNSMATNYGHFQNAYTWSLFNSIESLETKYWLSYAAPYFSILDMNIILNELKKSVESTPEIEKIRAQALFHRGRLFFELAQAFAIPYNKNNLQIRLGIPLRLSTDITELSQRSTIQETYDQIISDLTKAKDILPMVPLFLTRASKPAAVGMLAKVYLTMGDYVNAFKYANEYLQIKNELLDYSTIPTSANFIGLNKEVTFVNFLSAYSQLTTQYLIDQDFYNSYASDDLRKSIFFKIVSAGIQFKGTYGNASTDIFAGIATDEIYLIRSECYARTGNLDLAMKDLNDLLKTRWAKNPDGSTKYVDQVSLDETDALRKIFSERKKQLILRGVRWTDLRRLNQDDRFKITLSRAIGGKVYTLKPDDNHYVFPLPLEVLQRSNMEQNPGW